MEISHWVGDGFPNLGVKLHQLEPVQTSELRTRPGSSRPAAKGRPYPDHQVALFPPLEAHGMTR